MDVVRIEDSYRDTLSFATKADPCGCIEIAAMEGEQVSYFYVDKGRLISKLKQVLEELEK